MATLAIAIWRVAVAGRWTARILGTLLVLLFLALIFGEGLPRPSALTTAEKFQFLGMAALFFGLAAAWKWEGLGGLLSVAGFALLVALGRSHLTMWAFWLPAVVGLLHLLCWERLRGVAPSGTAPWVLSGSVIATLVTALALFVLLCANEIFLNPPLMTPSLHPSPPLAGDWHASGGLLTIHPDASVTGAIGADAITEAHIINRQSWFGKLMHFNSEYMIYGKLAGEPFTIGLWSRGEGLTASLYVSGRPRPIEFVK